MTEFMINSPLEQFEIVPLIFIGMPVINTIVFSVTNLGLYAILTLFLIVLLHIIANNSYRLVPSTWSISLEALVVTINSIVRDQIGVRHEIYMPFIYSLFIYLLITNLNGNIPYAYTVTTSGIAALGISMFVFIAVTIIGIRIHKIHFASFYVPGGTPLALVPLLVLIESVSYIARSVSLGVRLWANIVAGHTLLKILATFLAKLFASSLFIAVLTIIPFTVFVALVGLELAVSFIQSYVFVVLTCSYLKDSIYLH